MTAASKARPTKSKPARRQTIIEAMNGIFRPWFPPAEDGTDSWQNWKAILKAMDALPMSRAETAFFKTIAGGREPPTRRVREFVAVAARRTGKDSIISAVGAYAGATFDQQDRLRPGERAQILCLACDRDQAKIILNYMRSYFRGIPALAAMVERETKDGFALNNGVDIVVATNSFRAVRGKPILLVILDEAAFMSSETSANPDTELYAALRPGMLTIPNSRIAIISSPYRKSGLLWDRYRKHFGKNDDDTLVIQASVRQLNPTISQARIDAETEEDPAAAVSELLGQFRDDIAAFLSIEMVESAVDRGVFVRPYREGLAYFCGVDPSGGVSDSFTAAISHAEKDGAIVLDAILEIKAPFDAETAMDSVCDLIKSYGLARCTGDHYSAGFVVSGFAKRGVTYRHSERDRSKIYQDVLACFTGGKARLLDTPKNRLVVQFAGLQRETTSMGRDKIDHGPGAKDDLANAVALSMVLAASKTSAPEYFPPPVEMFKPSFVAMAGGDFSSNASMPPGGWPAGRNPMQGY
jgi:hypothetical protein